MEYSAKWHLQATHKTYWKITSEPIQFSYVLKSISKARQ